MLQMQRITFRAGAAASVATLSVHGLVAVLLLLEDRDLLRPLPAPRRLASTWISLSLPPRQLPAVPEIPSPRASRREVPPAVSVRAPSASSGAPEAESAPVTAPSDPPPGIDWHAAADRLAARNWQDGETDATFSGRVQKMREPCKPRDSSFEWSPQEEKAGLFPLPYVMVSEGCIIGLGFFSCSFGGSPPNKHLFDDMQRGLTPDSSAPDPNFCD